MPEETIETPAEAAPPVEAGAESQETIEETPGEEETPEPQEPTTQEMIDASLEKFTHKFQSWAGRRETEQNARFEQLIEDRTRPAEPTADPTEEAYTDPTRWLTSELDKRDIQASAHMQKVVSSAARMMDSDSLFSKGTTAGKQLGKAVTMRVAQTIGSIKPGMNVEQSAKMLINDAVTSVMRGKKPSNPLKGNKPTDTPLGTVNPKTPAPNKVKMPELDDYTKNYIKHTGMSEADVAKLLAGEK